jgi:ProP effector
MTVTTPQAPSRQANAPRPAKAPRPPHSREIHPLVLQLRNLYPAVFGKQALPLKLGVFHELLAQHPDIFEAKALREALGQHTRSTRYLEQVATCYKRHDLQGNPVEDLAPEHVHQAIMEVARRDRNGRSAASQAQLRLRLRNAFEASGLSRGEYAEQVKPPLEAWNALLDQAYSEHGATSAKREALRKAFEASGLSPAQFAEMYGMDAATITASLEQP